MHPVPYNDTPSLFKSKEFYTTRGRSKAKPLSLSEYWAFIEQNWSVDKPNVVAALENRREYDIARRIGYCRQRVVVMKCAHYFEAAKPEHDSELRLPYTCHTSVCPDCSKVYAEAKAKEYLNQLESFSLPKGYFYQFGTLTKKVQSSWNGTRRLPVQSEMVEFFKQARQFVNHFFPRRKKIARPCGKRCKKNHLHLTRPAYRTTYCGAIGVLEIGSGDNMHLHLLAVGPAYSRSRMSRYWMKLTGDSYILKFEPVRRLLYSEGKKNNLEAAVHEVVKYIRKPVFYDSYDQTAEMLVLLKNFRRLHTFGIFYNPRTVGGALEGSKKPEKTKLVCDQCQKSFLFYKFDEENLWWDEESYRKFHARDG